MRISGVGLTAGSFVLGADKSFGKSMQYKSKNWAWMHGNDKLTSSEWRERLTQLREAGFDAILLQGAFENVIPVAQEVGIEVHAWLVSLLRNGDKQVQKEHPEWFMISRNGNSTLDKPPHVGYYKWLCPSREAVHNYMLDKVDELLTYDGLAGIHLDYIRYPDVILPISLQPKYDIVQDKEYPQYDFCYCDVCGSKFKEKYGVDPLEMKNPSQSEAWKQYRYDQVTTLVNKISIKVHEHNRMLTAAVFPTPNIARTIVRQNWPDWDLDAVLPMMYNNFYHKDVKWIGKATRECRHELPQTTPLYSGLFVPSLSAIQVAQAYEHAMENGAGGICLFTDDAMSEEHWENIRRVIMRG